MRLRVGPTTIATFRVKRLLALGFALGATCWLAASEAPRAELTLSSRSGAPPAGVEGLERSAEVALRRADDRAPGGDLLWSGADPERLIRLELRRDGTYLVTSSWSGMIILDHGDYALTRAP